MRLIILLLSAACVVSYGYALAGYGGYSFGAGRPDYIAWGLAVGTLCGAAALKLWKNWMDEAAPDLLIFDIGGLPAPDGGAAEKKIPHWRTLGLPIAVYAGPRETDRALTQLGWEDFPRESLIAPGEISPQSLEILCRNAGAKNPFFFGSTPAAREAWAAFGKGVFIAFGPDLADDLSPVRDSLRFDTLEQAVSALLR
ncbi:MAG: hypothetical protein LBO82_06620 [Synergistaceae bacterium]|nr:hypothetical protein [Synergistaceae bacterium]